MVKEAINIKLEKNGLDIIMTLKVAPEIETYFKQVSNGQTETSSKWLDSTEQGLEFYVKSEKMSGKIAAQEVLDNFGNGLFNESGLINVALLRTVGATNGITIKTSDLLSYEEMKKYINDLAVWTRKFYENVLRPAEIKGTIGFEV